MIQSILRVLFIPYSFCASFGPWLLFYLAVVVMSIKSSRKEINYNIISRFIARVMIKLLGLRVKIEGLENIPPNEPVIFVSNHQSFFDICIAFGCIPNNFSFISKESVFSAPLIGKFMRSSGHISIKREAGKKAYDTMVDTINKFEMGKSLVLFPEGTRSEDGTLGSFKRGVSLIISQSGRRVVPMAINGSRKFLPRNTVFCHPQFRDITCKFGQPLKFEVSGKATRDDIRNIIENIRSSVSGLLDKP